MWSEIVGRGAPPQSNADGNAQEKEENMRKKNADRGEGSRLWDPKFVEGRTHFSFFVWG
jgi:hypothetical protein